MAAPRKVFRIEETAAARLARQRGGSPDSFPHGDFMQAVAALRGVMSASPSRTVKSDGVARGEKHADEGHQVRGRNHPAFACRIGPVLDQRV